MRFEYGFALFGEAVQHRTIAQAATVGSGLPVSAGFVVRDAHGKLCCIGGSPSLKLTSVESDDAALAAFLGEVPAGEEDSPNCPKYVEHHVAVQFEGKVRVRLPYRNPYAESAVVAKQMALARVMAILEENADSEGHAFEDAAQFLDANEEPESSDLARVWDEAVVEMGGGTWTVPGK